MEFREGVGLLTYTLTLFRYNIFLVVTHFIVSSIFEIIYLIFSN